MDGSVDRPQSGTAGTGVDGKRCDPGATAWQAPAARTEPLAPGALAETGASATEGVGAAQQARAGVPNPMFGFCYADPAVESPTSS
jgi:hypothetical protein